MDPKPKPRGVQLQTYSDDFHRNLLTGSLRSARRVVPRLMQLFQPRHVVDVGCGAGAWLAAFREHAVFDVLGIDGSGLDRHLLLIPDDQFRTGDLGAPLHLERTFDLAISLEVAEHLPASCADVFVDNLVRLAPQVVFSAAIPHQGGTHHINEQWPHYWVNLFQRRGYAVIDCLRRDYWNDAEVAWWYAQNLLVFCRQDHLEKNPTLQEEWARVQHLPLSLVHPLLFLQTAQAAACRLAHD